MVGADGVHHAHLDGLHQRLHILALTDGRVHPVIALILAEPDVVGSHLAGDGHALPLAGLNGRNGLFGGDMAQMQPGAVVFAQVQVADGLDVLGQAVIPGGDVHILGVGHDGNALFGADGKGLGHYLVGLYAVAVLGDEADGVRQGFQVVQRMAVKVLGDGHGLVCIAQADPLCLLLHLKHDLGRGAHRLGVGHQVYKGIAARCSRRAAGGNVLFVLKAGGAPMAVGVNEGRQQGAPLGVQHLLALFR